MVKIDQRQVIQDDFNSIYPSEMEKLDVHKWVVPIDLGGELGSLSELLTRGRWLASQNLTSAIALGQCLLGSLPVWIAGSVKQKKLIASSLLDGQNVCLALTEKKHGSDLLNSEVFYDGQYLNGEKWCINNATLATKMTVLANTKQGLSLLLVDKNQIQGYRHTAKIKTHGIRGADISGIIFDHSEVAQDMIIDRSGKGLEIVAKTLQVSRVLCSAFSLGAFEACLNMTTDFMQTRHLYGKQICDLDSVRGLYNQALWRFQVCESLATVMCRAATMEPGCLSLGSSVVKYLIPKLTCEGIEILGEILGARGYLAEEEYPLFEKMKRDHSVVPLFDGSSGVNLTNISRQMNHIKKHIDSSYEPSVVFNFEEEPATFSGKGLRLINRSEDFIFSSYNKKNEKLNDKLLSFKEAVTKSLDPMSYAARQRADDYCRLVAAICHFNRKNEVPLELFNKIY